MTGIKNIVKDLWLAVLLILVTSSVLLLSDRQQRLGPARMDTKECPDIAIMQINPPGSLHGGSLHYLP